jgi:hypothetical protein
MANFVFNQSKGRVSEFMTRINANDPTNSVLVILILSQTGIEADATLIDKTDVAALVSGTTDEVTNAGYARKVIDQTGGITITYDMVNDRVDVDCPDQTWTGVAAGSNWSDLVTAYDSDSTTGTDANVVPMTLHDFTITPDGSDITAQIAGFYRAS